jgi:putative FmdB family regulatory protein
MPLYDFECRDCGEVFEKLVGVNAKGLACPRCGGRRTVKRIGSVAVHVKMDSAAPRVEKRVKDYLKDGKFADATRFADKAASMTKSDRVKRIADKLHQKTGK